MIVSMTGKPSRRVSGKGISVGIATLVFAVCVIFAFEADVGAWQQNAAKSGETRARTDEALHFAPLETWKAAVLSGDAAALKALYSGEPPAISVTPAGQSHDPAAEANFWAGVRATGLSRLSTKIMRVDAPQPGVKRVVFTMEATMQVKAGPGKLFASIAQYWLEQNGKWVIVGTQRTNLAQLPQPIATKPDLYPDPSEAGTDIGVALAAAARDHKRVILDFGGNWCYDCHVLDAAFHMPAIAGILERNYIVVQVNIGEYDKNLDLAEKYQIPLKKGVPSLA
ncbi:MAG: thioredoxin family protein, partial [Candidatus Acidiferrales bacterium]